MTAETFWLLLTLAALVWYGTITLYVAVRGAGDIRDMLARLRGRQQPGNRDAD